MQDVDGVASLGEMCTDSSRNVAASTVSQEVSFQRAAGTLNCMQSLCMTHAAILLVQHRLSLSSCVLASLLSAAAGLTR